MAVSVSNVDLMERVGHLTTKIYREILCISSISRPGGDGRTMNITMGGLDGLQFRALLKPEYSITLSRDFLIWISVKSNRIPCSFTNFITSPDLSGHLYISPDIYHTEITECLLGEIYL